MSSRLPALPGLFEKLLLSVGAIVVALGVLEVGLRMSGMRFDRREPPAWLRSLIDPRLPPMPATRDPISDIALPPVAGTDIEIPPDASAVIIPVGKRPPPDRSAWRQPAFYRFDPKTGVTHQPRAEGWWMVEGVTYITINDEGFRDRNHALAKPPDAFRVVVLGDSNAEAFQVPLEHTFWSVLERRLQSCPSLSRRPVEVLNFGVSGFGTTQELLTYEKFARKYRPDVVLLAFFIGNDLRDNVRSLTEAGPAVGMLRPFHTVSGDTLVLDDSFLKLMADADKPPHWFERLRVVQLLRMVSSWFRYRSLRVVDARALISPPDPEYAGAWQVTEKLVQRLNAEVKADGARLVVATVSTAQQVDPDPERRARNARAGSIQDLFYPDKRLYRLSREIGFQMIPLAPAMSQIAERTKVYFHGFTNTELGRGHWNQRGHSVAGQILAKEICQASMSR
jgi:hypothetical protein